MLYPSSKNMFSIICIFSLIFFHLICLQKKIVHIYIYIYIFKNRPQTEEKSSRKKVWTIVCMFSCALHSICLLDKERLSYPLLMVTSRWDGEGCGGVGVAYLDHPRWDNERYNEEHIADADCSINLLPCKLPLLPIVIWEKTQYFLHPQPINIYIYIFIVVFTHDGVFQQVVWENG